MRVAIIGQGYVGQTLAYYAALSGHSVVGLDSSVQLIDELQHGNTHVPGLNSTKLIDLVKSKSYYPTNNPVFLRECEVIVIAVPTPLNSNSEPDLKYLTASVETLSDHINPNGNVLIVNESTSYPGTLRNIVIPLVKKKNSNRNYYASSPERVDPGNLDWNLKNTPRLIAGIDDQSTEKAFEFYSSFCDLIYRVRSPEVAEAAKIFENTFRQVNIALSNEFSEIGSKLGFSATEAIAAAATKPFGFMPFFPSIGVGGHCIPVDPSYLSYIAKINGINAEFIELANSINLGMAEKIVLRIESFLGAPVKNKRIQIAGIAYKPNVPDLREAPSLRIIKILNRLGAIVTWHDPIVKKHRDEESEPLDPDVDLGLIVTPHDMIDFSAWVNTKTKVLDLSPGTKDYGFPKFL